MNLDLRDLQRPGRPRTADEPKVDAREITEEDLAALAGPRGHVDAPRKKLRHKHHTLARALATGMTNIQAATIAGYTPQMVVILRNDPAFLDLIDFYASEAGKGFDRLAEQTLRTSAIGLDAIERRLEREADNMKMGELRDTTFGLLDRAGYGTKSQGATEVHLHAHFAEKLEAARRRAPAAQRIDPAAGAATIDGTFEVIPDAK